MSELQIANDGRYIAGDIPSGYRLWETGWSRCRRNWTRAFDDPDAFNAPLIEFLNSRAR